MKSMFISEEKGVKGYAAGRTCWKGDGHVIRLRAHSSPPQSPAGYTSAGPATGPDAITTLLSISMALGSR